MKGDVELSNYPNVRKTSDSIQYKKKNMIIYLHMKRAILTLTPYNSTSIICVCTVRPTTKQRVTFLVHQRTSNTIKLEKGDGISVEVLEDEIASVSR
jgi:hypothetical protein